MEIIDPEQKKSFEEKQNYTERFGNEGNGRVLGGIVLLIIGGLLIVRKMGIYFPEWIFSWQMLIIAIGVFVGAKHSFRPGGWLVPIFIGTLFLMEDWLPELNIRPYFWPIIIIIIGLVMIATPGQRRRWQGRSGDRWASKKYTESSDDLMESVAIFGGIKKNVISKNFRGGEAVSIFGGSEINLSQSDLIGKVELEIVQIFGGTKIIVPPHWQIKSEMVSIFGGIDDKRILQKDAVDYNKTLILKGVSIMGSIDIKSF